SRGLLPQCVLGSAERLREPAHRRGERRSVSVPGDALVQRSGAVDGFERARRARRRLAGDRRMGDRLGRRELSSRAQEAAAAEVLPRQGRAASRGRLAVSDTPFLSRWSKRKHAANRGDAPAEAAAAVAPPTTPGAATAASVPDPAPLPDMATLTPDSDFTGFMRENVPESLRRQALKTLFQDPRFNVMDGLDVYIDDYSKPDPLPEGWLEKMNQVARLGEYREPEPKAAQPPEPAEAVPAGTTPEMKPPEQQADAPQASDPSHTTAPPPPP